MDACLDHHLFENLNKRNSNLFIWLDARWWLVDDDDDHHHHIIEEVNTCANFFFAIVCQWWIFFVAFYFQDFVFHCRLYYYNTVIYTNTMQMCWFFFLHFCQYILTTYFLIYWFLHVLWIWTWSFCLPTNLV